MVTIDPAQVTVAKLQGYIQYAVAPRPICFASTIDGEGRVNLAPFSFFNQVSTDPPVLIFSPSKRVRNNTHKHTYENLLEVPEVVINIVNYDMVQQVSLASADYPKGVNEFLKAGFTELPSQLVRPPRVAESPVQFECRVKDIIRLGEGAGAGNVVLAEIKLIHYREDLLNGEEPVDQAKLDLVARLGGDWYARIGAENLFRIVKPLQQTGIGWDTLPSAIRNSTILSGNDLAKLAGVAALPGEEEILSMQQTTRVKDILDSTIGDPHTRKELLHLYAKSLLDKNNAADAWSALLS